MKKPPVNAQAKPTAIFQMIGGPYCGTPVACHPDTMWLVWEVWIVPLHAGHIHGAEKWHHEYRRNKGEPSFQYIGLAKM